jgi:L-rhamnono-1,4-lactonase
LVLSYDFISILRSFASGVYKFAFDVGIDQRSGGTWQLESFTKVLDRVYEGVPENQRTSIILSKTICLTFFLFRYCND